MGQAHMKIEASFSIYGSCFAPRQTHVNEPFAR